MKPSSLQSLKPLQGSSPRRSKRRLPTSGRPRLIFLLRQLMKPLPPQSRRPKVRRPRLRPRRPRAFLKRTCLPQTTCQVKTRRTLRVRRCLKRKKKRQSQLKKQRVREHARGRSKGANGVIQEKQQSLVIDEPISKCSSAAQARRLRQTRHCSHPD